MRLTATPLLPLLLTAAASAQVEVGDKAPAIETTAIGNSELCSLDAFRGRVVLYEFFAYW